MTSPAPAWRLAAIAMLSCASLSCASSPTPAPLRLDGSRLTVNNRTPDNWEHVEIWINRQYRVAVPEIPAGQRFDVTLDAFLDAYGNHFYFRRQQIRSLTLSGQRPGGAAVELRFDPPRSGLAGLADVGVFKGQR